MSLRQKASAIHPEVSFPLLACGKIELFSLLKNGLFHKLIEGL